MTDEKMIALLRYCDRVTREGLSSCDGCPAEDDWALCEQIKLGAALEIIDRLLEENRLLRTEKREAP